MSTNTFLSYLSFINLIIFNVRASNHFYGGSITYKPTTSFGNGDGNVTIIITQTYLWSYPTIYCNDTLVRNQALIDLLGHTGYGVNLNCISNCSTSGSYQPVPITPYCTDYSTSLGFTIGQRLDTVNLALGSYFSVAFQSTSLPPLTLYSAQDGGSWSTACTIDLSFKPNGRLNFAPIAPMPPYISIPVNGPQSIQIPVFDADSDNLRCRFATNSSVNECGSVCAPDSLPSSSVLFHNCTLVIVGHNANDTYAVTVQVTLFV
ncbi:unnamed protein product [Didymodactylos carnosus]|uniref:Uncharacterized protein n=1 Tax=Didymodactylos carnosus TaxID=1234261 RepID=A0A815Y517_9BILA|nr:unnamed protein product [Didymodactylos carnosus]CAF4428162.1 unnamed protein product [Didymodactylos carnosus]